MTPWTAIVIIVAIIFISRARRHRHEFSGPAPDAAYTAELEREVADLRKRLEVLERIATDGNETRRLASEIESLRDR